MLYENLPVAKNEEGAFSPEMFVLIRTCRSMILQHHGMVIESGRFIGK
jgi:hypothetical protein